MSSLDMPGLPTWGVVLSALLVPLVIAFVFLVMFDYANQPTPGPAQPGEGQQIADMNNALLMVHGLAQLGFVALGALFLARTPGRRLLFLAISIPFCGLVWLLATAGLIAK